MAKKKKNKKKKVLGSSYIQDFLEKEDKRKKKKYNYKDMGLEIEEPKKIPSGRYKGDIFIDPYGYGWTTGKDLQPVCLGRMDEDK